MSGRATSDTFGWIASRLSKLLSPESVRGGNLPAAAVVAVAVCGGHVRSCKQDQRPYGHPLVTAGHRGHRPRVTTGSASGRWPRRSQLIEANALTRCQAPSKSNRSTRSQHLRRCLAPTWRSERGWVATVNSRLSTVNCRLSTEWMVGYHRLRRGGRGAGTFRRSS